ncbi:MAG: hypothetical protein AAGF57_10810 [Pseudomonadota bacterium]
MLNLRFFWVSLSLVAVMSVVLPGCKLKVRVPEGGTVSSTDGSFFCDSGQTCEIDVVDIFFDQTFVAEVTKDDFYFREWNALDNHLCGGETGPCALSTAQFEGVPALEAMLESNQVFFLQPVFTRRLDHDPEDGLVVSPSITGH